MGFGGDEVTLMVFLLGRWMMQCSLSFLLSSRYRVYTRWYKDLSGTRSYIGLAIVIKTTVTYKADRPTTEQMNFSTRTYKSNVSMN